MYKNVLVESYMTIDQFDKTDYRIMNTSNLLKSKEINTYTLY